MKAGRVPSLSRRPLTFVVRLCSSPLSRRRALLFTCFFVLFLFLSFSVRFFPFGPFFVLTGIVSSPRRISISISRTRTSKGATQTTTEDEQHNKTQRKGKETTATTGQLADENRHGSWTRFESEETSRGDV